MANDALTVQKHLMTAWNAVKVGMRAMYPGSVIRPIDGLEIFQVDPRAVDQEVMVTVKPIVFKVTERAKTPNTNLFVAVEGWLSFELPIDKNSKLRTKSFSTNVGYFRYKHPTLEHVYGAHYDIDERGLGHPVFHAQIGTQMDLLAHVNEHYRPQRTAEDRVTKILRNVRTPSAQMDIFSVVAQICADHLIHEDSGQEVRDAFSTMRASCDFFIGAAHRMEYLKNEPAPSCYRSTHWYAGP